MITVKRRQVAFLLGDLLLMYVALAVTLMLRYGMNDAQTQFFTHLLPMSLIFIIWLLVMYANGLYDLYLAKPSLPFYRRFSESWIAALGVAVALFYFIPFFSITPKTNLFVFTAVFAIMFLTWRTLSTMSMQTQLRVLLVGPNDELLELIDTLRSHRQLGYEFVGYVGGGITQRPAGITEFPPSTPLRAITSEHRVNLIVVGSEEAKINRELYELLFWDVNVTPADTFFESLTGRIPLSSLSEKWFLEKLRPEQSILYNFVHRLIDYAFCAVGLIVLGLVFPFVAIIQKLSSPGPLFYKQERVGKNGKRFFLYKFRTMHALSKDGSAEVAGVQVTSEKDSRITPFGGFMRRRRIDELPQIINILKGDMSLIGPRPERPEYVYEFERHTPFYAVRHLVKPGITGWAQISYSYYETLEQQMRKFQYDVFYIKNRSAFLDIAILLKTLHVIIYGKGR